MLRYNVGELSSACGEFLTNLLQLRLSARVWVCLMVCERVLLPVRCVRQDAELNKYVTYNNKSVKFSQYLVHIISRIICGHFGRGRYLRPPKTDQTKTGND